MMEAKVLSPSFFVENLRLMWYDEKDLGRLEIRHLSGKEIYIGIFWGISIKSGRAVSEIPFWIIKNGLKEGVT